MWKRMAGMAFFCAAVLGTAAAQAQQFRIEPKADANTVTFAIDGRTLFSEDIRDYQGGVPVTATDIKVRSHTVAIRLGRDNDMFMIAAFAPRGGAVCGKTLFVRLRDGDNITILPDNNQGVAGELYGISFGRNHDLYNVYGIRDEDFNFVFDPSAPRTGTRRNVNTVIVQGKVKDHDVLDKGCR